MPIKSWHCTALHHTTPQQIYRTHVSAGDVELELPEGTPEFNQDKNRIRPSAGEPDQDSWVPSSRRVSTEGGMLATIDEARSRESISLADVPADKLALAQQQQQKGLQVRCHTSLMHFILLRCALII